MTKELKNAVSRLRKLQDAAFAGKIKSCNSCIIGISFHNAHYHNGDHSTIDVSVSKFNEYGEMQQIYWQLNDAICEENGNRDNTCSHEELLQQIAAFIDYPV